MFTINRQIIDCNTHKYWITDNHQPISYQDTLNLWQSNEDFRSLFIKLLSNSEFSAYRWETPPITRSTLEHQFEFVLYKSPDLLNSPNRQTFADYFTRADENGITVFANLGKDAILIVPSPQQEHSSYEHLASFIRQAPNSQKHALWRIVALRMKQRISDRPIWLNTAGAGVAWLHIRLDSRPKYYHHKPYKKLMGF